MGHFLRYWENILKKIKSIGRKLLIGNLKLLKKQLSKLKHSFKINKIDDHNEAIKDFVNIIDIGLKHNKVFDKISTKSNKYIQNSFKTCLNILNKNRIKQ